MFDCNDMFDCIYVCVWYYVCVYVQSLAQCEGKGGPWNGLTNDQFY